ncbi:hypothetical protein [Vibrio sp. ER1A]|uniref:hypothetical protein n=1 Tax=Vibrio sp. ER1A TaxID=1517681 RepID=UPI0004DD0884|nr:hypothetical protein [Vibrio sp. ER1A]KFA99273.1 hypothetical protein HW45_04840 [Vibrio sp. ER1A]
MKVKLLVAALTVSSPAFANDGQQLHEDGLYEHVFTPEEIDEVVKREYANVQNAMEPREERFIDYLAANYTFNVGAGISWNSFGDVQSAPTVALELIAYNKYMLGFQRSWHEYTNRTVVENWWDDGNGNGGFYDTHGTTDTVINYTSVYGGYFVKEWLVLKAGYTKETSTQNNDVNFEDGSDYFDFSTELEADFAMIGVGAYYKNFNINFHYNKTLSASVDLPLSDFDTYSVLLGYKF